VSSADRKARATAERAARTGYGKLVALLAKRTHDLAGAEDALSEAFAAALAEWPRIGVPRTPEAWLLAVARRKLIDAARRQQTAQAAGPYLQQMAEELRGSEREDAPLPDERLALMFACAHPGIDRGIRAPLILQTILGFDAGAIASAFLIAPRAMSQRLVRAKAKIKHAAIPFRVPDRQALAERLDAVLEAIYATFAAGWLDAAGSDARRGNLADEGLWLGRMLASLMADEAEVLGLLALMLHAEARRRARRGADGSYIPLADQDTSRWNAPMIAEAEALLGRAASLGTIGRYQLEAAVQSVHAARRLTGTTDWPALAKLYDALLAMTQSPVVMVNRAVAIAEVAGADVGLGILDGAARDVRLADYQPYWAARAELLARLGEVEAAAEAYQSAIGLEADPAVRDFLQARRRALHGTRR
jgi:RNA polymerase sigma-70 factor, ECF subfamily